MASDTTVHMRKKGKAERRGQSPRIGCSVILLVPASDSEGSRYGAGSIGILKHVDEEFHVLMSDPAGMVVVSQESVTVAR
jgi:hypothetical protein